ncbi:hypothetical protein ACQBJO_12895 [Janibacter sp. G349]|uniref:hypothetical protein n=1 Tax=Janibacter sp. G349 TaxID=3405424 RepID=UPI003B7D38E7
MMHDLTPDELLDANERCRQYAGKPLDECTPDDIVRVRAGLAVELKFHTIMRDEALHEISEIVARARARRRGHT